MAFIDVWAANVMGNAIKIAGHRSRSARKGFMLLFNLTKSSIATRLS
jgi:hypothetical protein